VIGRIFRVFVGGIDLLRGNFDKRTSNQTSLSVVPTCTVNLEKRVRSDHPLRRVATAIDFKFVRAEVARSHGAKGNVSADPEVILKTMFLLFFDDAASERELMKVIAERLDYLWFLGYGALGQGSV
jgi:transposase